MVNRSTLLLFVLIVSALVQARLFPEIGLDRWISLPLLLTLAPPGAAHEARPAAAADHQAAIATLLALPVAVGLVGARDRPVFAWVEVRAGVRNIWLSPGPGQAARRLTRRTDDDGIDIHDLALSDDGGGIGDAAADGEA